MATIAAFFAASLFMRRMVSSVLPEVLHTSTKALERFTFGRYPLKTLTSTPPEARNQSAMMSPADAEPPLAT